jgi:homoserine kinase type II
MASGHLLPQQPPHLGTAAEEDSGSRRERQRFAPYELATVLSHYDVGVIRSLRSFARGSRAAPKLRIRSDSGEYLLKRRAPGRDDPFRVAFCHCLQLELARHGYPVPRLMGTRADCNSMVQLEGRVYELFEFVPGDRFDGSAATAAEAGAALARLHRLLRDFHPPYEAPRGSYHGAADAASVFDQLEAAVCAQEGPAAASEVARSALVLRQAYQEAAARAEEAGFGGWPSALLHGDWHPGNILFRQGRVVAVLDFDSARLEPRMADVANGALQFSMRMTDPRDPLQWPEGLEADRLKGFFRGYDSAAEAALTPQERAAAPWLIVEALIIESVLPIAATGSFARLRGSRFLQMVERKVAWLRPRAASLVRHLASGGG